MDNQKVLTIKEIDVRMTENRDRLKVIGETLENKTSELGSAKGWKLPTELIHKAIDKLEHERRELEAEQEFLKQEKENIQKAITKKAAEAAAGEYAVLVDQLNPRAIEIIKGFVALQLQLIELENVQILMNEKALFAGKLVNPTFSSDVLVIRARVVQDDVYRILLQISAFTGKENIEKAGVKIPDLDEERIKVFGRLAN